MYRTWADSSVLKVCGECRHLLTNFPTHQFYLWIWLLLVIRVSNRCHGFLKLKMQSSHGPPVAFVDFKVLTSYLSLQNLFQYHVSWGSWVRMIWETYVELKCWVDLKLVLIGFAAEEDLQLILLLQLLMMIFLKGFSLRIHSGVNLVIASISLCSYRASVLYITDIWLEESTQYLNGPNWTSLITIKQELAIIITSREVYFIF